jgi:hypothetical protein
MYVILILCTVSFNTQYLQTFSTAFRLSYSAGYWRGTIPPARFKRIAKWNDYTGEEYRVAALQAQNVLQSLQSASTYPQTLSLHSKRHQAIKLDSEQEDFYHISGTRWLVDVGKTNEGVYTFLDIGAGRTCSTKLDLPLEMAMECLSCFYGVSPTEILLVHPGSYGMLWVVSKFLLSFDH